MEVDFDDEGLQRMANDPAFSGGRDLAVVKAFRKRVQFIRAAMDERAFYAMKSLHFEKLSGDREGQYSMRLNDQWRLIMQFREVNGGKHVVIMSITDYH